MESINVHRTPLNCYTLLRVFDSNYSEALLNKSKLLKAILFVLFTDCESFSHLSRKPGVEECSYVLGCLCKDLVKRVTRSVDASSFSAQLRDICTRDCIVLDVNAMVDVLLDNNIVARCGSQIEFRHKYWVFYFAAEWMCHDAVFRQFVLTDRNYVNYPEIIEFYAGTDGRRADVMQALLSDLTQLVEEVDEKIGIDRSFDPLSRLPWNPTEGYLQHAKSRIAEKVETSNLPSDIKDRHADMRYQSAAPYDQSIRSFLNEYSVVSLLHSIRAASRALRSSPFVDVALKHSVTGAIFRGWEEVARVIFWISPLLAKEGRAELDGFGLVLADGFSADLSQRFRQVIIANPSNVVRMLQGDLASHKIGPLLYEFLRTVDSKLQKHMAMTFIVTVRPVGWFDSALDYINMLHPRSFYLGRLMCRLNDEVELGDFESGDETQLKQLVSAILSKREYAPKGSDRDGRELDLSDVLNDTNRLPIDMLLKVDKKKWPSD